MSPLFVLAGLLSLATAAKLPSSWPLCKGNGNRAECWKAAAGTVLRDLIPGNQALKINPIDPMKFDKIHIKQGTGPVSINLLLTDVSHIGLKSIKIDEFKPDWKKGTIIIKFHLESTGILDGQYDIDGKVMVLPIQGKGPVHIEMDGFEGEAVFKGKVVKKKGKDYYDLEKVEVVVRSDKAKFNFVNLFNGNKALGDNINLFINENGKEILAEVMPAISEAYGLIVKDISKKVFSKFSLSELYLI